MLHCESWAAIHVKSWHGRFLLCYATVMIERSNPVVIVPARMASTRLPGKPLADIHGQPMIVQVARRAAEAAQGTGEAKDALAQMGITLRDQSGNLRRSEDLLADVADAFARIEDPAERVRLAFKLFDSEGVALVNLLRGGSGALEEMRERAQALGIVLDEHLVRDAERARETHLSRVSSRESGRTSSRCAGDSTSDA